jgi:beta-glucanase (GH16 family)
MFGKRNQRRKGPALRLMACLCVLFIGAQAVPSQTAQTASAVTGACVLLNGDFEAPGPAPWVLQSNQPAGAAASYFFDTGYNSEKSLQINIANGGANTFDVQLIHGDVAVVPGRRYMLSFAARASQGRSAEFILQRPAPPFETLSDVTVEVGTNWQLFNYTLDVPSTASGESPDFRVNIGQITGSIWLDNIALCEVLDPQPTPRPADESCMVRDGFYQTDRLSPTALRLSTRGAARTTLSRTSAGGKPAMRVSMNAPAGAGSHTTFTQSGIRVAANASYSFAMYARASQQRDVIVTLTSESGAQLWRKIITLVDPSVYDQIRQHYAVFSVFQNANNATLTLDLGSAPGEVVMGDIHMCSAPLQFFDDFSGTALSSDWRQCVPFTGDCALNSAGFEVEWLNPANTSVSNNTLKMAFTRERKTVCIFCNAPEPTFVTRDYAGVLIHTSESFTPQYGYFETRMKMPRSAGIWPAFWLMPTLTSDGRIQWPPEIDVVEHFTRDPLFTSHTVHYGVAADNKSQDGRIIGHPAPLADAFHTYAVNWTPDVIIWYVDGAEVHRNTTALVRQPMYLLLSTGSGGPAGLPADPLTNGVTEVDYVFAARNNASFGFDDSGQPLPTPRPPTATAPPPTIDPRLTERTWLPVTQR